MRSSLHPGVVTLALSVSLAVLPTPVHAIPTSIPIFGAGPLGSFTGMVEYTPGADATSGTVYVELTNTSSVGNGGFITAFAFNIPGNVATAADLDTLASFSLLFGNVAASPLGSFDIGATTDDDPPLSWLGGGDPHPGIGVGETASFTFLLEGDDLSGLSANTIMSTLSIPQSPGHIGYPFAVRFRGFEDFPGEGDGSDKVVGHVIPEPGTLLLLGGGLTALAMRRRRPRA